jgi:hypothetical protein
LAPLLLQKAFFVIDNLHARLSKSANTYFSPYKFVQNKKKTFLGLFLRQKLCSILWKFAILGLIINLRICDLGTGTPNKFADLRSRNEPKNLRICDLQTFKKSLLAHVWI